MTATTKGKGGRGGESLAKTILSFAESLATRLESQPLPGGIHFELQTHATNIKTDLRPVLGPLADDFDALGTKLWNLSTRLLRDDSFTEHCAIIPLLRVFAFQLLDRRQPLAKQNVANLVRLLRVGNKTIRFSLDKRDYIQDFGLVEWLVERAAEYDAALKKTQVEKAHDANVTKKLHVEYLLLRVAFAWKKGRLDIAATFFDQISQLELRSDPDACEQCTDLCYEIGKSLHESKDSYKATKWLERAHDTLVLVEEAALGNDTAELRLCILQQLIRSSLAVGDESRRERAKHLASIVEQEYPDRIIVPLINLEILAAYPDFHSSAYCTEIHKLINTGVMTEANLRSVLAHIHVLKDHDAGLAVRAIDTLITSRLLDANKPEWTEKACVTRIWLTTEKLPESSDHINTLSELLASTHASIRDPMSTPAAHACQTLLWKKIENALAREDSLTALLWCDVCTAPVFSNCGSVNKDRLARKKLLCLLQRREVPTALQVYNEMTEPARAAPLSNYLVYKLAAIEGDRTLAANAIAQLSRSPEKDSKLLYACVLEAQTSGDKQMALDALRASLPRSDSEVPSGVHRLALFRTTLCLLLAKLDEDPSTEESTTPTEVTNILVKAAQILATSMNVTPKAEASQDEGSREKEIQWFMTTAYNLALKYLDAWSPVLIESLFSTCLEYLSVYQKQEPRKPGDDTLPHIAICHFFLAQRSLSLAREEPNSEKHLQAYLRVQTHAEACESAIDKLTSKNKDPEFKMNIQKFHPRLVKANFEAALHLKQWDKSVQIIEGEGFDIKTDISKFLTDAVLSSDAPLNVKSRLIDTILATQRQQSILIRAKWCRIMYILALEQGVDELSAVVSRVCSIADDVALARSEYPREEAEWLATQTFNRCVDAYCASEERQFRRMGQMALILADRVADRGALKGVLMSRLGRMNWEF